MGDVTSKLLLRLKSSNVEVQGEAVRQLTVSRHPSALSALSEAMSDEDPDLRASAAEILFQRGGRRACELLEPALRSDPNEMVRITAAAAMGVLGYHKAIPTLIESLKDSDELVRVNAAESLGDLRATAAIPNLFATLDDRSPLVRGYAAAALGEIGKRHIYDSLASRLKREHNTHTRLLYYYALYILGNSSYLHRMIRLLRASHYRTRCAAANLLTQSATPGSLPQVEQALRSALEQESTIAVKSTIEHCLRDLEGMRKPDSP